jgi:penicillin-binding protein 1A
MVTRIETGRATCWPNRAGAARRALDGETDKTLLDVMRDVVTRGTGQHPHAFRRARRRGRQDRHHAGQRGRLVHPDAAGTGGRRLGRLRRRSRDAAQRLLGQGAHSALPIVGEFFQRAQRARIVDAKLKFDTEPSPGWFASVRERVTDLFDGWFGPEPKKAPTRVRTQRIERQPDADAAAASAASAASAPEAASGGIVEQWIPASEVAASAAAMSGGASQAPVLPPPAAGSAGNAGGAGPGAASGVAPGPAPAPASPESASSSQ